MSDETTKRIGDYEILKELGAGGMGKVYQVRNVITDRIEAMKVLLPDLAATQDLAARFLREVKLTASLDHPNICALRTAFSNDNRLYMVMEYVEGTTMATKLDMGPLSVNDAVKYISQVLSAVSYAHQRHIIHRDIKPANMMLTTQGMIKLMDFGIARSGDERGLTMTGTTLGSIGYMSPEQVKGDPTDARSDLYSVGIVLYEFVTGRRPFVANSEYSIMAAHLNQTPKPPLELNPGLPAALNEIILMAIAKEPAKRFQTADAFANALTTVPASSAVAPTVPRTPIGGPTGGSGELPAGFWEASPTMERPSGARTPVPPAAPIAATLPVSADDAGYNPHGSCEHDAGYSSDVGRSGSNGSAASGRNRRASNAGPDAASSAVGRSSRLVHDAGSSGRAGWSRVRRNLRAPDQQDQCEGSGHLGSHQHRYGVAERGPAGTTGGFRCFGWRRIRSESGPAAGRTGHHGIGGQLTCHGASAACSGDSPGAKQFGPSQAEPSPR